MERKPLFKIIVLYGYDLLAPFVCHQCGACCRKYFPHIFREDLPEIARILKKAQDAVERLLAEDFAAYASGAPRDCCFLDQESHKCLIHEIKPESCLLFPICADFGPGHVDCPGYEEFQNFIGQFLEEGKRLAAVHEPESYKEKIRRVPDDGWPGILKKAEKAKVSPEFLRKLVLLNRRKIRDARM